MHLFFIFLFGFGLLAGKTFAQSDSTQRPFRFEASEILTLPFDIADMQVTTASKSAEGLRDAGACVSVITASEIQAYGAINLLDVLEKIVGTYIIGSYYLPNNIASIRGDVSTSSNNHVLFLLDGRPLRESMYAGFNTAIYHGIPLSSIERVEVIRGTGSVLYGTSAFTGVVNIILKQGKKQRFEATQLIGTQGTRISELSMGFEHKKLEVASSFRLYETEGWKFQAFDEDSSYLSDRTTERGMGASLRMKLGNFSFNNFVGTNRRNIFAESPFEAFEPTRQNATTRIFNDLAYQTRFSDKWRMQVNFTHNYLIEQEDKLPVLNVHTRDVEHYAISQDFLLEMTHYFSPTKNINLLFGGLVNDITGHFEQHETNADGTEYDYTLGNRNPNFRYAIAPYQFIGLSAYAQSDFTWKKLKFIAGGQFNNYNNQNAFVPRLGIIYNTTEKLNFKLLYGQAFRAGSVFEKLSTEDEAFGNNSLKPEFISTIDFQTNFNTKNFYGSFTFYRSFAKDLIILADKEDSLYVDPTSGEPYAVFANNLKRDHVGIEIETRSKLHKNLTFTGLLAWQDAWIKHVEEEEEEEHTEEEGHEENDKIRNFTGIPPLMLQTGLLWRNGQRGLSLGIFNNFYSRAQPLNKHHADGHENEELKNYNPDTRAYSWLSAKISLDLRDFFDLENIPSCTLSIFGQNLLNAKVYHPDLYRSEVNTVPGRGGRSIYGKLTVRF